MNRISRNLRYRLDFMASLTVRRVTIKKGFSLSLFASVCATDSLDKDDVNHTAIRLERLLSK